MRRLTFIFGLMIGFSLASAIAHAAENPFQFRSSVVTGYDDNTALDSTRKGDGFTQETAGVTYRRPLIVGRSDLKLSYDIMNLDYYEATDFDFLVHDAGVYLNYKVLPATLLEANYDLRYAYFPNNDVNFYDNEARLGVKQKLAKDVVLGAGFSVLDRAFEERMALLSDGTPGEHKRNDERYQADAELGVRVWRSLIARVGFLYYFNDSNDLFHDFYDYNHYRLTTSASYSFTKKVSAFFKFYYEDRDYVARSVLNDAATTQNDDTLTYAAGLFYRLTANLSLGSTYTYQQRYSNEPSQTYSDSITTLGLYAAF